MSQSPDGDFFDPAWCRVECGSDARTSQSPDGDFFDPALPPAAGCKPITIKSQSPDGDFFDPAGGYYLKYGKAPNWSQSPDGDFFDPAAVPSGFEAQEMNYVTVP